VTTPFLGRRFAPITLADKAELQAHLRRFPQRISGYTFASLFAWSGPYGFRWARSGPDCVWICRPHGPADERHLLQPLGPVDGPCLDALLAEARRLPYRLKLLSVAGDFLARHPGLAAHFDAVEDTAGANYLYRARDLADLPGRRYAKKRNLIAQFEAQQPDHAVAPLDAGCHDACREVLRAIARGATGGDAGASLRDEAAALDATMANFEALEQAGVLVRVGGRPVAFSVFERLDADVAAVHFEKADRGFKGLYQVVNRASARAIAALGCGIVNREEDLGDEGLRQAKRSYHPVEVAPIFDLTLRG
jgi:hypothetical protein